jgi:hypothetical protein
VVLDQSRKTSVDFGVVVVVVVGDGKGFVVEAEVLVSWKSSHIRRMRQ